MGNVVQSDLKGLQLFLNELDKGEAKARANRAENRQIQNDRFKKDITLGQMGLMMNDNGSIVQADQDHMSVINAKVANERIFAENNIKLDNLRATNKLKLQADLAQSEDFNTLRDLNQQHNAEDVMAASNAKTAADTERLNDPGLQDAKLAERNRIMQSNQEAFLINENNKGITDSNSLTRSLDGFNQVQGAVKTLADTDPAQSERLAQFLEQLPAFKGTNLSVHSEEKKDLLRRGLVAEVEFKEAKVDAIGEDVEPTPQEIEADLSVQASFEQSVSEIIDTQFNVDVDDFDDLGVWDAAESEEFIEGVNKVGGMGRILENIQNNTNLPIKHVKNRFFRFFSKKLTEASASADEDSFFNAKKVRARTVKSLNTIASMVEDVTGKKLPQNARPQRKDK